MFDAETNYLACGTTFDEDRFHDTFRRGYGLVREELFPKIAEGERVHRLVWTITIARMHTSTLKDFMSLHFEPRDHLEPKPKNYLLLPGWFMNAVIDELAERVLLGD